MNRIHLALAVAVVLLVTPGVVRADVILDWNALMQSAVAGQNPFAQARSAAITQLAVFEAVNTITREYNPYLGTLEAPTGASADAAAVAAAYRVLKTFFPTNVQLDEARATSLAAIADSQGKTDGIAVGEAAAVAMIALRAADGSAPPQFYMPPPTPEPGAWQRTAGCPPAGGILLHWRNVTPFGIESSLQFRSAPPPALTSTEYAKNYNEVKAVGGVDSVSRPADRADVARFYNVVLAVATWNDAIRQVAAARATSTSENARTFALLNMAISDALVSVMETKYHYTFWRPVTAIAAGDTDGNDRTVADPQFVPFIPTPCFPGYPSAHASASYAAAEVARRIFGAEGHSITLTSGLVSDVVLSYSTFKDVTRDIDDARVFGGIHFRFDQHAGAAQGQDIGKYISKHLLRPIGDETPE
jgi:hypothetical protein